MKIVVIFMASVVTVSSHVIKNDIKPAQDFRDFSENIILNKLFEALKAFIKNGSVSQGIPVLDPFQFTNQNIEILKENIVRLNMSFTSGIVEGLGDFEVLKSEFIKDELLALDMCITFPSLSFRSEHYNMDGAVFEAIPLLGSGKMEVSVLDLKLWSKISLKQADDSNSLLIDKITNPGYNIQQVLSTIEYDRNIDAIANAILSEVVPEYLNRFSNYIANMSKDMVIDILNLYLQKLES